ncbi:MAG TPA: divalent-cation tolerance protein CutA [Longimicrobiales bacterium]|nr:divalent-cation tolerance protein CutA [Longimicrobiales bacterium]
MQADGRVVLVTASDAGVAEGLVRRLVEEGLVACGNIIPGITSVYRWRGEVERTTEALVVFKTTAAGAARLVDRVPELHPYDVPEVLVLPVEAGYGPYMEWIAENVSAERG